MPKYRVKVFSYKGRLVYETIVDAESEDDAVELAIEELRDVVEIDPYADIRIEIGDEVIEMEYYIPEDSIFEELVEEAYVTFEVEKIED